MVAHARERDSQSGLKDGTSRAQVQGRCAWRWTSGRRRMGRRHSRSGESRDDCESGCNRAARFWPEKLRPAPVEKRRKVEVSPHQDEPRRDTARRDRLTGRCASGNGVTNERVEDRLASGPQRSELTEAGCVAGSMEEQTVFFPPLSRPDRLSDP
jgi:hypothetical protein